MTDLTSSSFNARASEWAARAQTLRPVDERERSMAAHEDLVSRLDRDFPGKFSVGQDPAEARFYALHDVLHEVVNGLGFIVGHLVGNSVVDDGAHNSSPSVDGGSSPTVGDGQVAGVENTAPATDVPEFGDEVLAELAASLHEAVRVEIEARRVLRSSQRTQALATENLGDAQKAVADARTAIINHITGGQA